MSASKTQSATKDPSAGKDYHVADMSLAEWGRREMNIAETESHRPRTTVRHTVETSWWSGEAEIPTFEPTELLATKLRALYQRSKGRDSSTSGSA